MTNTKEQRAQVEKILEMAESSGIMPLKAQAKLWDEILKERLEKLLPQLMHETGTDMWIIISEEFNPDPVLKTVLPSQMAVYAPRLSAVVFYRDIKSGSTERYCLYAPGTLPDDLYTCIWDRSAGDQYFALKKLVEEKNPSTISLNFGSSLAHCNGLAINVQEALLSAIGSNEKRIVSSEPLSVRWLETRTQREIDVYKALVEITRSIVKFTFSPAFIESGTTTTEDIEWRMRELMVQSGLSYWFGPDVDLQRYKELNSRLSGAVIEKGDILHCDLGLAPLYIPLHTDMQQIAYVKRDGETEAPSGLRQLFCKMKKSQEIIIESFKKGRTGNEMFFDSISKAKLQDIDLMLYTHPVGYHGHGAGPCLGRYDNQGMVKGQGELKLHDKTCYALEHNVSAPLSEWGGQRVFMYIEEDICFDGEVGFINGCQDSLMLL